MAYWERLLITYFLEIVPLNSHTSFRSHAQNSCFVFHKGFQTPRNNKSTRPAASCFHLFLGVWNPWWNTKHEFLTYYLKIILWPIFAIFTIFVKLAIIVKIATLDGAPLPYHLTCSYYYGAFTPFWKFSSMCHFCWFIFPAKFYTRRYFEMEIKCFEACNNGLFFFMYWLYVRNIFFLSLTVFKLVGYFIPDHGYSIGNSKLNWVKTRGKISTLIFR